MNAERATPAKENVVRACECGTTMKVSSLDEAELDGFMAIWEDLHGEHERVSLSDAQRIRHYSKRGKKFKRS